jgi:hypothetical protein
MMNYLVGSVCVVILLTSFTYPLLMLAVPKVRTGLGHRGSQIHSSSYPTAGISQSIQIVPSLPLPEYGVPVTVTPVRILPHV